ncbi:MAG: peptidase M48 [Nitrospirae bacterium]|nr:MAG: peptidase M48 [Nitrospirota bacterium]
MRKRRLIGAGIASMGLLMCLSTPSSGFLEDLFAPRPPKDSSTETRPSPKQKQDQPDLMEGLGGLFGAEKKDIDLLKKGLGVIQALQPIGEEEELALGQAVAVEAFSRFGGEYHNASLTRYVNLVGQTIAEVSDRPNLAYHFAILNSEEQNAFAAPGGYIFVTIGLLKTLKNEAELAGVLAHEIAHVTQKHMLETIRRSALLSNVSELTLTVLNKDPQMFSNLIDEIADKLFTKGLDKEKEFEADEYGVEFAYRAGYNPRGLRDYLVTLQSQEGRARSRFFSTHPNTSERIAKLDGLLRNYPDGDALPLLAERFARYLRSV